MNIEAYNKIIDTISPVLEKKGMNAVDGENGAYFCNETQAVKVIFDEAKKLFKLCITDMNGDTPGTTWSTASEWIFDSNYTVDDAVTIGNDFSDTLNMKLGLKHTVRRSSDIVVSGDAKNSYSIEGLLQKFLTFFPQYKERYQAHVDTYHECLYVHFLEENYTPELKTMLTTGDKKKCKKNFEMLNEFYCYGDFNTQGIITGAVLKELITDENFYSMLKEYIADYKYLKIAVENMKSIAK